MMCPTRRGRWDSGVEYRTSTLFSLTGSKYINNTVCPIAHDSVQLTTIGLTMMYYIQISHAIQSGFNGSERTF